MPVEVKSRHWTFAIFLQLGIRLRYLFTNYFGLKPLLTPLTAYASPWRPRSCPKYDFFTQTGFIWLWFFAGFARDTGVLYVIFCKTGVMYLANKFHEFISKRLITQFENCGYTSAQRDVAIPEYDWKNGDPDTFYKTFAVRPHPVVLRGFMKDTALLKELNWDSIMQKYGEEDVFLTTREMDGYPGKLKEVDKPNVYLHNSEKMFSKYPDIRDLFDYERLEPYLRKKVGYEQIFVGREGTGSPFHDAGNWNMFYQIDGKKTWWFIDPYDTFLGYPLAMLGRAAGFLMCLWPDEYNREAFPLFQFCPVYSTTLEPGDVLFNPPWWWHSIKNVTPTSVGVASRWHTDGIVGNTMMMSEEDYDIHRTMSFFFQMGLPSWAFLHGILQTPSPRYDEHMTLRETNNRYVHKQMKISDDGGVDMNMS
mmetsp:Transcript_4152/g.9298  ORF Transcript_4152/g.9298 Transcript_4152/m.9298 type:complete len:421 (-) Transcript_4152:639-1901(-)